MAEAREVKLDAAIHLVKGHFLPHFTNTEWLENAATEFKPRDTDVFIVSFPKSGTHWLGYIVYLLIYKEKLTKTLYPNYIYPFDIPQIDAFPKYSKDRKKFVNLRVLKSTVDNYLDPRIFVSHFPYKYLPQNPKVKYLYIYRNPKDILISAYHHLTQSKFLPFERTFEEFFKIFIETNCFNFCNHFRGYFDRRDDPNYFILSYEELRSDFTAKLQEIAIFFGIEITKSLYALIEKESSFDSMKSSTFIGQNIMRKGATFFPRGVVGAWQNILTKEQSDKIDQILLFELGEDYLKLFPALLKSKL